MSFGDDPLSKAFEKRLQDYEEKVEREKKEAQERGEVYVECADWQDWRIHDPSGYWVDLCSNDWKIIQRYLNEELYYKRTPEFLNEMASFIAETMCKDCAQKCEKCAVNELKKSIDRRLPPEEYEDY